MMLGDGSVAEMLSGVKRGRRRSMETIGDHRWHLAKDGALAEDGPEPTAVDFEDALRNSAATLSGVAEAAVRQVGSWAIGGQGIEVSPEAAEAASELIRRVERVAKLEMDKMHESSVASHRTALKNTETQQAAKVEKMRIATKVQIQEVKVQV